MFEPVEETDYAKLVIDSTLVNKVPNEVNKFDRNVLLYVEHYAVNNTKVADGETEKTHCYIKI
jgi:hypothetical protein